MANNQVEKKAKEPRLFLRKLFTLGWESREVMWPTTVQTPEGKTVPFTPKYADGVSGAFKAWRGESKKLLWASIFFLIFLLPLLTLLLYGRSAMLTAALASSYNFMGNIGIGYPGAVDSLPQALAAQYGVYKIFFLYFYAGAVIASIGMAGMGNYARKVIWNEPIKKIAKPFFDGIKKHWWKYLLVVAVSGAIALGICEATLYHLTNMTLGTADAASWTVCVIPYVLGVPLLLIAFTMLTILPSYKLNFWQVFKNSIVITVNRLPSVIMGAAVSVVPLLLIFLSSIFAIFVYILMIGFGCSLCAMLWTGLGHSNYFKCAVLYEYIEESEKRKKEAAEREKKYAENREVRGDKPKVKQSPQKFVNPKKKKKKKK
jgi:uncharacterized membrane protein YesL